MLRKYRNLPQVIHIVLEVHLVPVGLPNALMLSLEMAFFNLETEELRQLFRLISKINLEYNGSQLKNPDISRAILAPTPY